MHAAFTPNSPLLPTVSPSIRPTRYESSIVSLEERQLFPEQSYLPRLLRWVKPASSLASSLASSSVLSRASSDPGGAGGAPEGKDDGMDEGRSEAERMTAKRRAGTRYAPVRAVV